MMNSAPPEMPATARFADRHSGSLPHRLAEAYDDLTEAERKVAEFIIAHPADLATFSARELAQHSGVSGATISRLVRRVGYDSYEEARREARSLRESGAPFHLFAEGRSRDAQDLLLQHATEEARLIQATLAMMNTESLRDAAAALAAAPTLWFVGFRNSRFLADYACAAFGNLRGSTHALVPSGQTLAECVAGVSPEDVVVAFGMRRRVVWFRPLLAELQASGARILLIADRGLPPLAARAHWHFPCTVETSEALDSYVGPMAVIRMLALETMHRLGRKAGERLRLIEAAQARLRELE